MARELVFRYPLPGSQRSGQRIWMLETTERGVLACEVICTFGSKTREWSYRGVALQKVEILKGKNDERRRRTYDNSGKDGRQCRLEKLTKEAFWL
ncbi:hypothetical protein J6590_025225 [Homalodisca vitripennis]|nr:hypothetical protein J6590_025225 [Homalodisca vitripennis]